MKKLLTAGLVLLSVATLAACGNKSSDSASKASSSTEQTSASSKTDNSKTNTSEVTLLTDEEIDKAKTIGDMKTLFGKLIDNYKKYVEEIGDYLALNAGLVAMNLVLALTDQGIGSNIILGFDKSKTNEVLEIEERFRPELLITVGYTDEKLEPSYRLPVDEIIEKR